MVNFTPISNFMLISAAASTTHMPVQSLELQDFGHLDLRLGSLGGGFIILISAAMMAD